VFTPLVSEVAGTSFAAWFDQAWSGALYAHPGDPVVSRALTTQLGGMEQASAMLAIHELTGTREAAALRYARASLWWAPSRDVGLDALRATGVLDGIADQLAEASP